MVFKIEGGARFATAAGSQSAPYYTHPQSPRARPRSARVQAAGARPTVGHSHRPVSRASSATERLCGGNIRRRTDSFSSFEYLDILHHPAPPASAIDVRNTVPTSLTRGALAKPPAEPQCVSAVQHAAPHRPQPRPAMRERTNVDRICQATPTPISGSDFRAGCAIPD